MFFSATHTTPSPPTIPQNAVVTAAIPPDSDVNAHKAPSTSIPQNDVAVATKTSASDLINEGKNEEHVTHDEALDILSGAD